MKLFYVPGDADKIPSALHGFKPALVLAATIATRRSTRRESSSGMLIPLEKFDPVAFAFMSNSAASALIWASNLLACS
jgi:hypothetical protein